MRSNDEIRELLIARGVQATAQRIVIAREIFRGHAHYSAEEVFERVNRESARVSKATVYNTLGLFARRGLVREVIADPDRVYYDTNVVPHHHFYDIATGQLTDIPADDVTVGELPAVPSGMSVEGVDVIIRIRPGPSRES